jgi:hypothetical protein
MNYDIPSSNRHLILPIIDTPVIKASEPVVSVILGLIVNGIVPKPFTAASLLPITYGVAYASTLGQLDVKTMSRELTTKAAKYVFLRTILRSHMCTSTCGFLLYQLKCRWRGRVARVGGCIFLRGVLVGYTLRSHTNPPQ